MTPIEWLMQGDPAIRWQVMRDLTGADDASVTAERARVATEGLGAQLLALQAANGLWGGAEWKHNTWDSTMHALWMLRDLGIDPADPRVQHAVALVRENVTWRMPPEIAGNPFFAGETEPCINGQVASIGAYFRQDVSGIIERLLGEQLADGGWNCEAEFGSKRSSFNTTICVLEALLECEHANGADPRITAARHRGEKYLLERRLFRRQSTGEVIEHDRKSRASWLRFAFPTWWHYDVLRALDYLRAANVPPDPRLEEPIALVESSCGDDGRWPLGQRYPGAMLVELDAGEGQPSRWITLRAMRTLRWYRGDTP